MILQSFAPAFGAPSPSPFCVKAMCLLTMAGRDWSADFTADVRKAPHKKLPVLIDGARILPDSAAIEQYLTETYDVDFDAGLNAQDRARSHALKRMAEEHLYFAVVYDRWMLDENWVILKQTYFNDMPWPLRLFVPSLARAEIVRNTKGQGLGRMSHDDIMVRARADISAIEETMADKPFLFGSYPTSADAAIAPLLSSLANGTVETPLLCLGRDNAALMAYVDRCKDAIYPDKAKWA